MNNARPLIFYLIFNLGVAFIFSDIFDEYSYNSPEPPRVSSQESDDTEYNVVFEVPLNILIDCLNIFGTAGTASTNTTSNKYKKWKKVNDDSDHDNGGDDGIWRKKRNNDRGIESYFGSGSEKRTSMRMTYLSPGYPLTLLL